MDQGDIPPDGEGLAADQELGPGEKRSDLTEIAPIVFCSAAYGGVTLYDVRLSTPRLRSLGVASTTERRRHLCTRSTNDYFAIGRCRQHNE
jgi:hypothetical protein